MEWTENEISFLLESYPKFGPKYIGDNLNRSVSSINIKLKSLGIRGQINNRYEVFESSLSDIKDLYIMGFLWADGYLHDDKNRLELSIVTEDFVDISELFDKEKWSIKERIRLNRKPQTTIGLYKKEVCDIFRNTYNYLDKSLKCPNFIDKIPKELLFYFVRGFFDGDGCFYLSKDNKQKQCYLAGTYDQDWLWMENILNDLSIEYSIKRKIQNENSKYSVIYIVSKDIKKFGEYIYKDYDLEKIGLKRKYEKFLII